MIVTVMSVCVIELVIIAIMLKNRQKYINSAEEWRKKALLAERRCDFLQGDIWKLKQEYKDLLQTATDYISKIDRLEGKVLNMSIEAQKRSLSSDVKEIKCETETEE